MRFVIRIFLAIFMMLGLCTSASIQNAHIQGWKWSVLVGLALAHFLFGCLALVLAVKSQATSNGYRIGLSPAGWLFGSFFSYLVGFVGLWALK